MDEVLRILGSWLLFFLKDDRYRIIDSRYGPSFNDALVVLASDTMRWQLVNDRAQIFLDCQPQGDNPMAWYSTDLLFRLLTSNRLDSAVLTEKMASWFEANLSEIEARFSNNTVEQTLAELRKLKKLRAKEMFG